MTCFHCGATPFEGANTCACMFCAGKPCIACLSRRRTEQELALAARMRIDVRDIANYELTLEGAPTIKYRRLKLPEGVRAA